MQLQWENEVRFDDSSATWRELAESITAFPFGRIAYVSESVADAVRTFAWAVRNDIDFLLVDSGRLNDELTEKLRDAGFAIVHSDGQTTPASAPTPPVAQRITVLTSGTTGTPKLVPHTIQSLATMTGVSDQPPRTWLVPYAVGTYAWYQLVMMSLTMPQQTVVMVDGSDPIAWLDAAGAHGVTAISATPTFWRRALLTADEVALTALPLEQITLGGEPVDQPILDRLHSLYPAARISHIYASSEAGACMAVHDGKAGFPQTWLERTDPNRVQLAVREGLLFVRSPHKAQSVEDEWFATNDRAEIVDGRVLVLGRSDANFINVGGTKVDAAHVAQTLQQHPSVLWARVKGRKAPLIGQMPVAEVVLTDSEVTSQDIVQWAGDRLPKASVPRIVRILDHIPTTSALKSEVS